MNKLIEKAVRQPGLVLLITLIIAIAGFAAFRSLPIDAVPDITNIQVQINTSVEGLVPEEIERFITYPIESGLGGIPGVDQIRSITRFGLSQVTVIFEEGTQIFLARQLVSERLQSIKDDLPNNVQPVLGPITTGLGEVYFYSLDAKEKASGEERVRQLMELKTYDESLVHPRLLMVPGVAEVNSIGGYEKQYFVQPRLADLSRYGIHLDEIVVALEANNRNTGGGYVQQTAEQLLVQATGLVKGIQDIESIVIKKLPNFATVTIKDVADVRLDRQMRTGAALVNGEEKVLGTVLMLLGGNSRTVSEAVDKQMDEIRKALPNWVELKVLYNRSDLVNQTIGTVERNLLFGAALVALIILVLIGNVRVAIITAVTIPLSLLVTFLAMKYFNISGNLMSLGALDFGIIIDGAVIVMDNCVRRIGKMREKLGRSLSRSEVKQGVIDATIEIRSAAGFGQLIIIIVFLPLFGLTGVEAKMFTPMAATFCFALAAAFILSFTTIPALAGLFLSGDMTLKSPKVMKVLERGYAPILKACLRLRYLVPILGVVFIAIGLALFMRLGANFLPQLDEGSIAIQFVRPNNISLDQSIHMQSLSEKEILTFPEVENVVSRIGTAEIATDPMGVNISDTYVLLKPMAELRKNATAKSKEQLIEAIKEKIEGTIAGQSLIISQPIQLRFNELLEGVRADVALKVFGDDMDKISDIGSQAAAIIRTVEGAGDVEEETKGKSPLLRITPRDRDLHRMGLAKESVLGTVETALGGKEAGSVFEGVLRFPIIVRLNEEDRSDIHNVKTVPVGVGDNVTVPLADIADVKVTETHSDVRREQSKKRAAVLINVRGRDTSSFVKEARAKVEEKLKVPSGYYLEWGGSFRNLEMAKERLAVIVPLALLLVFVMIYMAFQSVIQTILIAVCIPLALVGGVLSLMLNGLDFSISAAVGFIALSGIAVLNGIVLVSYFNRLKVEGLTGKELIMEGTRLRLRPVLMTALGAALGFLPMMLSTGAGAEVQRPIASVVVGGVISSTALTLMVLPVLYMLLERRMRVFQSGGH